MKPTVVQSFVVSEQAEGGVEALWTENTGCSGDAGGSRCGSRPQGQGGHSAALWWTPPALGVSLLVDGCLPRVRHAPQFSRGGRGVVFKWLKCTPRTVFCHTAVPVTEAVMTVPVHSSGPCLHIQASWKTKLRENELYKIERTDTYISFVCCYTWLSEWKSLSRVRFFATPWTV